MIDILKGISNKEMFDILSRDNSEFTSLDIDYHPPRVERIQTMYEGYRISFHIIHPCKREEALYHPHAWPSAVHVMLGKYEMGVSHSLDLDATEETLRKNEICKTVVSNGMYYEMLNPHGFHYVRPVDEPVYSIMLMGPKWDTDTPQKKATKELKPLEDWRIDEMKKRFKQLVDCCRSDKMDLYAGWFTWRRKDSK